MAAKVTKGRPKKSPARKVPKKKAPSKKTSAKKTSAKKAPAKKAPDLAAVPKRKGTKDARSSGGRANTPAATTSPARSSPVRTGNKRATPRKPAANAYARLNDMLELWDRADRDPSKYPHGLMLQDPGLGGGEVGWYWFSSPEDRIAWIQRGLAIDEQEERDDAEINEIIERVRALGSGPAGKKQLRFSLDVSAAVWLGTLEELRSGAHEDAQTLRDEFWSCRMDELGSDDECPAGANPDVVAPIPDDLLDDFLSSLVS